MKERMAVMMMQCSTVEKDGVGGQQHKGAGKHMLRVYVGEVL